MREQPRNHLPLGPERIQALAHAALDDFAAHLKSAAGQDGGALGPEDIDALALSFKTEARPRLVQGFRQVWETCMSDYRRAAHDKQRNHPFMRILVHQFRHLLSPDGGAAGPDGTLSRRMIPGFLHVLEMMIGPDRLDQYERRGTAIVGRLKQQHGAAYSWLDYYRDAEAQWLANDVLVRIARHFADLAKRRSWLIDVVGSHLRPVRAAANGGKGAPNSPDWRFGEAEFDELMQALYADLRRRLDDDEGGKFVLDRYGQEAVGALSRLLADLGEPAFTKPAYAKEIPGRS